MTPEQVVEYVQTSQNPVSARNMAHKFHIRRKFITRVLHLAAIEDSSIKKTLLKPHNVKHKKPVWNYSAT